MKEFRAMINFSFVELTVEAQDEAEGKLLLRKKLESIMAIASDVRVANITVFDKGEIHRCADCRTDEDNEKSD